MQTCLVGAARVPELSDDGCSSLQPGSRVGRQVVHQDNVALPIQQPVAPPLQITDPDSIPDYAVWNFFPEGYHAGPAALELPKGRSHG